jgi:1,2-diacylglycerol 3-alpha-glucosyltransferase
MAKPPVVMVSSYAPRWCGIATFAEEAREFIQKTDPDRKVLVVSHTDGSGEGVFPVIDMRREDWWKPVAETICALEPHAVHIEHEYGLYEYVEDGKGDGNQGFLKLLEAIRGIPTVIEPHTVHGRLRDAEAAFIHQMCRLADVVIFKCHYQKWRVGWNFSSRGWDVPANIMVVPHGARSDRRWSVAETPRLKRELGLDAYDLPEHLVGMIGWIQTNKRWDILLSLWGDLQKQIEEKTGQRWGLLAAGAVRDPHDQPNYEKWKGTLQLLEARGQAHFHELVPRGDDYYKMMAVCDFVVLPSIDETQSGTLARVIALNKPYITTAPMEGLTAQTLESGGGLLFSNKAMLAEQVVRLATSETLRMELGNKQRRYLDEVVSWEVVAKQYEEAYRLARKSKATGKPVVLEPEF